MIQQMASFMAQVLILKFALNDVPHSLGMFGSTDEPFRTLKELEEEINRGSALVYIHPITGQRIQVYCSFPPTSDEAASAAALLSELIEERYGVKVKVEILPAYYKPNPTAALIPEELKKIAYAMYADLIKERFGTKGPLSLEKIYYGVGIKKGLSRDDSNELVRGAIREGHIKKYRLKIAV